jgi:hypothetical protein
MEIGPPEVKWQAAIIRDCEKILGRKLREPEKLFISSRAGYIALEMIHDHVKALAEKPDHLERYLNSETRRSDEPSDRQEILHMTTLNADIPCPRCHKSFAVPLAEMGPGKSRSCPNCGEIMKFAGQDPGKMLTDVRLQKRGSIKTDIFNAAVLLGYEDLISISCSVCYHRHITRMTNL